jgi:hypothetical protein
MVQTSIMLKTVSNDLSNIRKHENSTKQLHSNVKVNRFERFEQNYPNFWYMHFILY